MSSIENIISAANNLLMVVYQKGDPAGLRRADDLKSAIENYQQKETKND